MGDIKTAFVGETQVFGKEAPAWTPASFTDVQYWWTAGEGITDDGSGNVETWTDQINSYDLSQTTTANMPSIGTSDHMNDQNVVTFNGTSDFIFADTAPASLNNADLTMLAAYYLDTTTPGAGLIFGYSLTTGSPGRMWVDGLNNTQRMWDSWPTTAGGGRTLENPITVDKHAFKLRYDASAGDSFSALDTLTETTQTTGGNTNQDYTSGGVYAMGATLLSSAGNVFLNRYIAVEIAEAVVIHGTPTSDEMDEWKNYVNTKYGTIIS